MSEQGDDLTTLKLRRGQIKGQLTRFQNFLGSFDVHNTSMLEVETRLSKLSGIFDKFEEIQNNIELISREIQNEEREFVENAYYKISAEANSLLQSQKNDNQIMISQEPAK